MKTSVILISSLAIGLGLSTPAMGEEAGWYARAHGGLSGLSDADGNFTFEGEQQPATGKTDTGGFAGIAGGYSFGNGWRTELAWEYRRNDFTGSIGSIDYPTADFASSIMYLNSVYAFGGNSKWTPYVGAGIAWAQEVDIDFERDGVEQSYSSSGNSGLQVFAGLEYTLSPRWVVSGELRYGNVSSLDLEPESGAPGMINDIDYQHTSLQLGLSYQF